MRHLKIIIFTLLMAFSTAHAELITVHSPLGPATAVRDTNTGLEWLKLPETFASVNDVFAGMAPGRRFEGFRYSTYDEFICGLIGVYTQLACQFPGFSTDPTIYAAAQAFVDLFGARGGLHTVDPPIDPGVPLQRFGFGAGFLFRDFADPREVEFDSQQILIVEDSLTRPSTHWLVREVQAVPEPSTLVLLGLGIILLTLRAMKIVKDAK